MNKMVLVANFRYQLLRPFFRWKNLFGDTVSPNDSLFGYTVPPNYSLFEIQYLRIIRYSEIQYLQIIHRNSSFASFFIQSYSISQFQLCMESIMYRICIGHTLNIFLFFSEHVNFFLKVLDPSIPLNSLQNHSFQTFKLLRPLEFPL